MKRAAVAIALMLAAAIVRASCAEETAERTIEVVIVVPPHAERTPPVFTEERLRQDLRSMTRKGCDPVTVVDRLTQRYKFLGYVPTIEASCNESTLRVRIRESSHTVDLITFETADLSRLGLKPDPEFEEKRHLYPVPADAPRAVLRGLLLTREGDLYNFERYRSDSEALARLGYTVAFIPAPPSEDSDYPRGAYLVQSLTLRRESGGRKRKTNYLGGTASYGPQQKGQAGLLYQKDELFGEFDRLSFAPTYSSSAGGSLSYFAPLLALRQEPHRLYDFEASAFSDFVPNRQLDTVVTDQRRTGFSATLGIRPLLPGSPHSIRFLLGLRDERISLAEEPAGEEDGSTYSMQLGAFYDWRHTYRRPSLSGHLEPRVDMVFRAHGGEVPFVRAGLTGVLHSRHRFGVELDAHFVGGTIDREVPSFELWSLGGPNTVRGFREDSFLGRHIAALQTEIWLPFVPPAPIVEPAAGEDWSPENAPFEPRAVRLFKWALFVDGGTTSGTLQGTTVSIGGAGIGVRFLVPHHPFVVKADYGWGLGARGGEAFPYISLSYRY